MRLCRRLAVYERASASESPNIGWYWECHTGVCGYLCQLACQRSIGTVGVDASGHLGFVIVPGTKSSRKKRRARRIGLSSWCSSSSYPETFHNGRVSEDVAS